MRPCYVLAKRSPSPIRDTHRLAGHRTEARGKDRDRLGVVARPVWDTAVVVNDAGGLDDRLLAVLADCHGPLDDVEDVRRVGVVVGLEFRAGPEREGLHEHVLGDDTLGVEDFARVGVELLVMVHTSRSTGRHLAVCTTEAGVHAGIYSRPAPPHTMAEIQLVRNATLLVEVGGTTLLVDPMLSEPGAIPPIPNSPNDRENPLAPSPHVGLAHDAVLVTHRHRDHFDDAAVDRLAADDPVLCQPAEAAAFREDGFEDVRPVEGSRTYAGVEITRTPARHGHGELAEQMAPVSGFVLEGEQRLYLAGDTVWYDAVPETLDRHDPDCVVVNAGAAEFVEGRPITMDIDDVRRVCAHVDDDVPVIADHMEAINHCLLTREELRAAVDGVTVPEDGETISV